MKKILLFTMAITAVFGLLFVSCQPEESQQHEYTQEELDEIARQDSLKQIIPADYILTQDITVPLTDDYSGITVSLIAPSDTARFLDSIGYATTAEFVAALGTCDEQVQADYDIKFFAYNFSTKYEYDGASTTNYFGHWFDANGDVCSWGDEAYFYCEKQNEEDLYFTIACYPSRPTLGAVYHIVEAIEYDGYKVAFLFNLTVGEEPEAEYPNTTLAGTSTNDIEEAYDEAYTTTEVAIDASAIETAIGIAPEDAEIYAVDPSRNDSLYIDGCTANNGYWFNLTGDVCSWGDDGCAIFAEYSTDDQVINVGQYPTGVTVGETYSVTLAFVNLDNLKQYNVVINVTITDAAVIEYPETTLETTLNLSTSIAYEAESWVGYELALDSAAINNAIGCGPSVATLYGVNATTDSLYIYGNTATYGYFFNASGDVCEYGDEGASLYVEYYSGTQTIGLGQYPGRCTAGQTYTCTLAFVYEGKQANVEVAVTITE